MMTRPGSGRMASYVLPLAIFTSAVLAAAASWLVASRRRLTNETAMFAGFMEYGPFVAFMKDAEGRYLYENRELVELIHKIRPGTTTTLGRTDRELFPAPEGDAYIDHDRLVIEHGKPRQFDETSVEADGTVRSWSTIKFPLRDRQERPCVAGISIDVTTLRQARTDARSSADQVALAVEAGRMGTLTLDLATQMLETSALFATLHGRPATKTRLSLAESLDEVHPEDRPTIVEAVQAALSDKAPKRISYRVVLPDGAVRWIELVGRVSTDENGQPVVVRGVGFDTTDERAAYDELARRKAMLRRLLDVQENERQMLCHELHDGLLQYAIGAKMMLESCGDEADAATRSGRIGSAINCLERAITEGRQIIRGVRPSVLDDLGLAAAIEDLRDQMAAMNFTVEVTLGDGLDALEPALCNTVYRVVQESISNARKHAGTGSASVEVRRVGDDVELVVRDRGSGFVVHDVRTTGFGIVGMTERVRLAGGTFWIESRPVAGTQVNALLPIHAANDG